MVTRQATLLDFGNIGEMKEVDQKWIIQWMRQSKDNPQYQSLVTVDKKSIKYFMFNVFDKETNTILNVATHLPDKEQKSLEYLVDRAKHYFEKQGFNPVGFTTTTNAKNKEVWLGVGFNEDQVVLNKKWNGVK